MPTRSAALQPDGPAPHLHREWAHPPSSAPGLGSPPTSALGLGLPLPTSAPGLGSPPTSAAGLGPPLPHSIRAPRDRLASAPSELRHANISLQLSGTAATRALLAISASGLGARPSSSAQGLCSPLPHLRASGLSIVASAWPALVPKVTARSCIPAASPEPSSASLRPDTSAAGLVCNAATMTPAAPRSCVAPGFLPRNRELRGHAIVLSALS